MDNDAPESTTNASKKIGVRKFSFTSSHVQSRGSTLHSITDDRKSGFSAGKFRFCAANCAPRAYTASEHRLQHTGHISCGSAFRALASPQTPPHLRQSQEK